MSSHLDGQFSVSYSTYNYNSSFQVMGGNSNYCNYFLFQFVFNINNVIDVLIIIITCSFYLLGKNLFRMSSELGEQDNTVLRRHQPTFDLNKCIFNNMFGCSTNTSERLSIVTKGLEAIQNACVVKQEENLLAYLRSNPSQVLAHSSCRKQFTYVKQELKRKIQDEKDEQDRDKKRQTRSETGAFNWKEMCFFCAKAVFESADRRSCQTLELLETVLEECRDRSDEWAIQVQGRLGSCTDLPSVDAVYHSNCRLRFYKGLPETPSVAKLGRCPNKSKMAAFDRLCQHLDGLCEDDVYTLDEVHDMMGQLAQEYGDLEPDIFGKKHMQTLLMSRYGEDVTFADKLGRKTVVSFKDTTKHIINQEWYNNRKKDTSSDSVRIVQTAAQLVATQIRNLEGNMNEYPTTNEMLVGIENFVPPLLHVFLSTLIKCEKKETSIAQSIVQAARPQSIITPLQLGLAVSLHHEFRSESLLLQLSRFGFCASYDEVTRFHHSVMESQTSCKNVNQPVTFVQYVADNVDHNVRTLDGSGTFHGMGIISATVNQDHVIAIPPQRITRVSKRLNVNDVVRNRGLAIIPYALHNGKGLSTVTMTAIKSLNHNIVFSPVMKLDMMWHIAGVVKTIDSPRPNWSGYMQSVCVGPHAPKTSIKFLPIVDLNPSDESCIYSTLMFVDKEAKRHGMHTTCITFDQPLYIKAVDISIAANLDVVVRLGGFHTLMSFMGAIGHVMRGSGIDDVLKLIFGPNTVETILTGKSYSRAIRGHFLLHGALTNILLTSLLSCNEENGEDVCSAVDQNTAFDYMCSATTLSELETLYDKIWCERLCMADCEALNCECLLQLEQTVKSLKQRINHESRTGRLWLLYMHYIDVLKLFIAAERTGNWHLHVHAVQSMLNVFASTGHSNYAKSARLYVQQMQALPTTHSWLYEQFVKGYHSIRMSDRLWSGLSTDYVIEATLMRSLKSRCGLTRGSGMRETVRSVWVHTMGECANIRMVISDLTGTNDVDPEHVDVGPSRMRRDWVDFQKLVSYLQQNSPFRFADSERLISLSSGVVATDKDCVTSDCAEEIGLKIQESWDGKQFTGITYQRSKKIKTLADIQNTCKVAGEQIIIDFNSLFHRLIVMAERSGDIKTYFAYELTQYPTSLFKDGFMRKPVKPDLYKDFAKGLLSESLPTSIQFVIDGGYLLHKVRWLKRVTLGEILQQYANYLTSNYDSSAVVVFDGYEDEASTKDHEHKRRRGNACKIAPDVALHVSLCVVFEQAAFLANVKNKKNFLDLLKNHLSSCGWKTHQANGDADVDIVKVALQLAMFKTVAVVAEDTDILALLIYHRTPNMREVFLVSDGKRKSRVDGKCINVVKVQDRIGPAACGAMLVLHALGGCDTTSAIYGIGKRTVYGKFEKNNSMKVNIAIMQSPLATREEVEKAGLQFMVHLYGGKSDDTMQDLRYASYCRQVASSVSGVHPERLPPSESAARFHILRVHHQAVMWHRLGSRTALNPTSWGWRLENDRYEPITTTKPVAPDEVMTVVRCGCQNCDTQRCSCRSNGLKCVTACRNCRGSDCCNSEAQTTVVAHNSDTSDVEALDESASVLPDFLLDDNLYYCDEEIVM